MPLAVYPWNFPKAGEWLRCQRGWCLSLSFPFLHLGYAKPSLVSCPASLTLFCVCTKLTKLFHSCLIPCDPMDFSPPGSSVHGISQARVLEWVVISLFRGCFQPASLASPALAGGSLPPAPPGKPLSCSGISIIAYSSHTQLCFVPKHRTNPFYMTSLFPQ